MFICYRRLPREATLLFIATSFVMLMTIISLLNENYLLKNKLKTVESSKVSESQNIPLQPTNSTSKPLENEAPREFAQENLTILLYKKAAGKSDIDSAFNSQLENVKKKFPSSQILWNNKNQSLGKVLNHLVPKVKTEYFLFLEPRVSLSDRPHESITSLWDALQRFPELDFVGGSYLSHRDGKLQVPCHRFRLCRWTFSESYEYERSLENVMICEGISSSFMARTKSVEKVNEGFDGEIPDLLVIKEFFLRAKSNSVVAGTRPNVLFLVNELKSLHDLWSSGDITKIIVPFAVKHKVFQFKDTEGKLIEICSPTSPLSGKGVCIEENSHKQMLDGGHWAYQGLYTYPYLLKYLQFALSEVVNYFNQHNVSYCVHGGVSLGAIKTRSILPWEAGDVDFDVYEMTQDKLYKLLKPLSRQKGYSVRKFGSGGSAQVQIFCTPRNVGYDSGGLASILLRKKKAPPSSEFVKIQTNGVWVRYKRDFVSYLSKKYGVGYLQHKIYNSTETASCKIKGHNACLPNFKTLLQGKAGTSRDLFCEI